MFKKFNLSFLTDWKDIKSATHVDPVIFYKQVISKSNYEHTTTIGEYVYFYFTTATVKDVWYTKSGGPGRVLSENEFIEHFKPLLRREKLKSIKRKARFNKFKFWKV
jgi:hypothetical protein